MPTPIKIATQAFFLSFLAAAVPAPSKLREYRVGTVRSLLGRDGEGWKSDDDGPITIRVSPNSLNWGQGRVDGGMLDWAMDKCSDVSCGSGGKTSETETYYISDYHRRSMDIKLNVDGTFTTEGDGTWSHMKDLADATLKQFEDVSASKWTDYEGCFQTGTCEKMAENNNNGDDGPMMEGWYPDEIHIVLYDDDGGMRSKLDVTLGNDKGGADWEGVCDNLTSVGSTLAGLVSGIGSAAFALGGLLCSE